jgi:hypothetical protein
VTHSLAADQMHVQVMNLLPGMRPCVGDQPVSAIVDAFLLSELARHGQHSPGGSFLIWPKIIDGSKMAVRDYQQMNRGQWIDVAKGCHELVRIHDLARYLTLNYAAEDAITHAPTPEILARGLNCSDSTISALAKMESRSWPRRRFSTDHAIIEVVSTYCPP